VQNNAGCSNTFLASLSYSQVAGLFLGMVVVGFTVDRIGRKAGSITTALIMAIGSPPTLTFSRYPSGGIRMEDTGGIMDPKSLRGGGTP
jgi:MFS family permease